MLMNFELGWAWLHNPKAAGISVSTWLNSYMGFEPIVPLVCEGDPKSLWCYRCSTLSRHCWCVVDKLCDSYAIKPFCVVRDPVLRTLSGYLYYLETQSYTKSFESFVTELILPAQANYVEVCLQHDGAILHLDNLENEAHEHLDFVTRLGWNHFPESTRPHKASLTHPWITTETIALVQHYYSVDYGYLPEYIK